jgi:putative DNA primase/helicase
VNIQYGRDVFDLHPHLFNLQNGTIDLRSGKLQPHSRKDFLTRVCPVAYRRDAPRAGYLEFLKKAFHGKPSLVAYVRMFSGYIITGETCDHSFHVFHGDGSNGKGVLVLLWTAALGEGEYAHTAAAELLVNDGKNRHPTEKVGLRGARLVLCSESNEDGYLAEAKLKNLTSDDLITARSMRQDFFQFPPTHKFILQTNHKPRLRGTDHGIRRRLRLVPFAVRFWKESDRHHNPDGIFNPEFRADTGLLDKLRVLEAEGIIADMVENARHFYVSGKVLTPPNEVLEATSEYIRNEDIIGQFFEACVREDADGVMKSSELYGKFKLWGVSEGYEEKRLPGIKTFSQEAEKRFGRVKTSKANVFRVRLA